jgi:HK97 family phage major capsid protein
MSQVEVTFNDESGTLVSRWYAEDELRTRAAQLRSYPRPSQAQRAELAAIEHTERRRSQTWALAQRQWNGGTGVSGADVDSGYNRQAAIDQGRAEPPGGGGYSAERFHPRSIAANPSALIRSVRTQLEADYARDILPGQAAAVLEAALTRTEEHTALGVAEYLAATGSRDYYSAFGKVLSMGPQRAAMFMSEPERHAMSRALTIGTPASFGPGSYPVPYQVDPTVLLTSTGAINPLRQICRVEEIVGREWLGVTSTGVTVSRQLESTPATDNSPSMSQPGVAANRVQAFVPFSVEVEQDWNGLLAEISMMLSDGKDIEEAGSFLTGNGTAPNPQGIITALAGSSGELLTATTAVTVAADVFAAENALAPRFRARREWIGSVPFATFGRTTQRGALVNRALLEDLPGDRGEGLLGRAFYEHSGLGAINTSASHPAIVGDWKQFMIVDRIGMSVELVPHLFQQAVAGAGVGMPTGQRGIYAMWRNNSILLPPASANALVALKVR